MMQQMFHADKKMSTTPTYPATSYDLWGGNTFFAMHSWQIYRNTGSKLGDMAKNPVKQVEVSFIKGAGESQRSAPAFAGKCRLVRRGGEWQ